MLSRLPYLLMALWREPPEAQSTWYQKVIEYSVVSGSEMHPKRRSPLSIFSLHRLHVDLPDVAASMTYVLLLLMVDKRRRG
jgi:hypothetical protein